MDYDSEDEEAEKSRKARRASRRRLYRNNLPDSDIVEVVRCSLGVIDGRWRTIGPSGTIRTARGLHVFVVQDGRIILNTPKAVPGKSSPLGHVDLAMGLPVEFGGEIWFEKSYSRRGVIRYWNDQTGHYHDPLRPMDPAIVTQLPLRSFRRAFGARR